MGHRAMVAVGKKSKDSFILSHSIPSFIFLSLCPSGNGRIMLLAAHFAPEKCDLGLGMELEAKMKWRN